MNKNLLVALLGLGMFSAVMVVATGDWKVGVGLFVGLISVSLVWWGCWNFLCVDVFKIKE